LPLILSFVHRLGLQAHQTSFPSYIYCEDTAYWQKSQGKEELEQIKEPADCIRENNEIIRKAINSL
jgi:hypothetical protein